MGYSKRDVLQGADDSTGSLTLELLTNSPFLLPMPQALLPTLLHPETWSQNPFLPYDSLQDAVRGLEPETGSVAAMAPLACLGFNVRSALTKDFPPQDP